jgi:hypothetical protein
LIEGDLVPARVVQHERWHRRPGGGTAGVALDKCYHQLCDDLTNLTLKAWGETKDAAADVLYQLALTKNQILNG